jgi:hypothetical protein
VGVGERAMSLKYEMARAIVGLVFERTDIFSPDMRAEARTIVETDFEAFLVGRPWKYIEENLHYYQDEICTLTVQESGR